MSQKAFAIASRNARATSFVSIWTEVAAFLDSRQSSFGRLGIRKPASTGRHRLDLRRVKPIHESLRHRPVLHLDATVREGLIGTVLRGLEVEIIEAKARHQHVRLVIGSFGKSTLCQQDRRCQGGRRERQPAEYKKGPSRASGCMTVI